MPNVAGNSSSRPILIACYPPPTGGDLAGAEPSTDTATPEQSFCGGIEETRETAVGPTTRALHRRGVRFMRAVVSSHLPKPVGRQKEVLVLPAEGHTVVLGTAGSGKTTLAIHRSIHLADPATDHGGLTLLLTFNKCLVAYLQALAGSLGRVEVRTYHHFARGYLDSLGMMRWGAIASPDEVERYCAAAIAAVKSQGVSNPVLDRPMKFIVEEFRWLAHNGISSAADYVAAERVNRAGTRVARGDRPAVFSAYAAYLTEREAQGKLHDWDDLASAVLEQLSTDIRPRMYRHVVVDEGQDFSPQMIRSLAAAIPADGSLTFFGDMAQQIYGNKISWRSAGLSVGQVWNFEENYRNTKQISQLALAISQTPFYHGVADIVVPKAPIADGPLPALVECNSEQQELQFVARQAQLRARTGTVAVLFQDREQERRFTPLLSISGTRLHRDLKQWNWGPGLFYGTYHSAKGLEFDAVYLPHLSSAKMPHPNDVAAFDFAEAAAMDVKRLYVGVTRARSTLVLTYSGELSPLVPTALELMQRSKQP